MSGLFTQLFSSLSGADRENAAPVTDALHEVLGLNGANGISGLLGQFSNSGLSQHIQSWIGTGENAPISADDVNRVLSNEQVQALIQKTGLPIQELMPLVAKILPHAVDEATPGGQIPDSGTVNA